MISRDILQNFRDNNLDNIDGIEINVKKDLISVYAPKEFDLRELYFVGSNKKNDPSTIGEFGEGFKCAVVSMLKKVSIFTPYSEKKLGEFFDPIVHILNFSC